jgi:hypothetical protein
MSKTLMGYKNFVTSLKFVMEYNFYLMNEKEYKNGHLKNEYAMQGYKSLNARL